MDVLATLGSSRLSGLCMFLSVWSSWGGSFLNAGGESTTVVAEVTIALSPPWEKTLLPEAVAAAQLHPDLVGLESAGSQRWTVLGTRQWGARKERPLSQVPCAAALLEFLQTAVVCSAPTDWTLSLLSFRWQQWQWALEILSHLYNRSIDIFTSSWALCLSQGLEWGSM